MLKYVHQSSIWNSLTSTWRHFWNLKTLATNVCFETAHLGENERNLLPQKVTRNVAISLGNFIFSKTHNKLPKFAQLAKKITQSGHPAIDRQSRAFMIYYLSLFRCSEGGSLRQQGGREQDHQGHRLFSRCRLPQARREAPARPSRTPHVSGESGSRNWPTAQGGWKPTNLTSANIHI